MKRDIYNKLLEWKNRNDRRPLILRGARQVGKSFILTKFGENEFNNFIVLNFEKNPEYKEIFSSRDPKDIIERIILFTEQNIIPGKTFLFLDEVQECPEALMSLRYFFEEKNDIHIAAAGSLLEFTISSKNFKMPVGRVEYLYLYPLSFLEFISALKKEQLKEYISKYKNLTQIPAAIHNELLELIRKYFLIGGMPAVVSSYIKNMDILRCQSIQNLIIETYMDDFGKYARETQHSYLNKIFNAVPQMVGQKFKYSNVDKSIRSRELKGALELLEMAGLVYRVQMTSGAGLPLSTNVKDRHFKTIFLDIGLLHAISGIYSDTAKSKNFTSLFNGLVAEQFIGQELVAIHNPEIRPKLYYWGREAKNSNAELDYLIVKNNIPVPIEVKAGISGKMKSMSIFQESYNVDQGIKISQSPFSKHDNIIDIPFYGLYSLINSNEI